MSERDDQIEIHDLTVARITDEALAHINAGNIKDALLSLERGVVACEEHPSFSRLEGSACEKLRKLIVACHAVATRTDRFGLERVRALLDRMHVLRRASLN